MHSKSDNIEIMSNVKVVKVIEELFEPRLSRYQIRLEKAMRGSDFIFEYGHLVYYICYKINFKLDGSCIDSHDCIIDKKVKINPVNKKYNKCFQYTMTVALNHEEIPKNSKKKYKN